jgi:hypothetical protein
MRDEEYRMDESRRRVSSIRLTVSWRCRFHGGAQEVSVPKGKLWRRSRPKGRREESGINKRMIKVGMND